MKRACKYLGNDSPALQHLSELGLLGSRRDLLIFPALSVFNCYTVTHFRNCKKGLTMRIFMQPHMTHVHFTQSNLSQRYGP
jgi:hypothetical protein